MPCARDGLEALEVADRQEWCIDLLLADVVMPHVNGMRLAKTLAARRPGLRTILMTGYPDGIDLDTDALPDVTILEKPVSLDTLCRIVRARLRPRGRTDAWRTRARIVVRRGAERASSGAAFRGGVDSSATNRPPAVLAISEAEYRIHRTPRLLRRLVARSYPVDLHSGQRIREFVALADEVATRGLAVVPHGSIGGCLERGEAVLKFGKTDPGADLDLLARHPEATGEWNRRNLEEIADFNHYLDLGRRTWNLFLRDPGHRDRLRGLFAEHGALFVKSTVKGHAGVYDSYEALTDSQGDPSGLPGPAADVLVSETLRFRRIEAATGRGATTRPDEWRHHVYRGRRVATTHAFPCRAGGADPSGESANTEHAEAVIATLRHTDFATTYVLDTGTLADGRTTVVETNSFFSTGIYTRSAVRAIAGAIAAG